MKSWIQRQSTKLTPQELSDAIFSGQILYFENLAPMREAVAEAKRIIENVFAPYDPELAHQKLELPDTVYGRATRLSR